MNAKLCRNFSNLAGLNLSPGDCVEIRKIGKYNTDFVRNGRSGRIYTKDFTKYFEVWWK